MNKLIFLGLISPIFLLLVPNVYASGIRHDPGDDATLANIWLAKKGIKHDEMCINITIL